MQYSELSWIRLSKERCDESSLEKKYWARIKEYDSSNKLEIKYSSCPKSKLIVLIFIA